MARRTAVFFKTAKLAVTNCCRTVALIFNKRIFEVCDKKCDRYFNFQLLAEQKWHIFCENKKTVNTSFNVFTALFNVLRKV